MKQVFVRNGDAVIEDVSAPVVGPYSILVKVENSCLSVGTEGTTVALSAMPLWRRAMKQTQHAKKVLKMVKEHGILRTKGLVNSMLSNAEATGYSNAGTVIAVGEQVKHFTVGDRVACAGAQCAYHAEVVNVPENLAVKIPEKVTVEDASTVTLGAIAMQGVRRLEPTLGETVVVVGLGLLGQLSVQMLKANGCKVIALDLNPQRVEFAKLSGADIAETSLSEDAITQLTDGYGADAVLITAASQSSDIIANAFHYCRKRGRVVLVGDVGLDIDRNDMFKKELDFRVSCSYGPGRYDDQYELLSLDYPLPYVRWTENRNMQAYLELLAAGRIDLKILQPSIYDFEQAPEVYKQIKTGSQQNLVVLFKYSNEQAISHKTINPKATKSSKNKINMAVVGGGLFVKAMHLPNLKKLSGDFHLKAIVSATGHNAKGLAKQYGADYSSTDFDEVLKDKDVDAILIATRHNLHADMVLKALQAGKHVLVEKPLAMNLDELTRIKEYFQENKNAPILMTGFNRRFSPHTKKIKSITDNRKGPMIVNYRMNAGALPLDHWTYGEEGGGRNIGEACHIYDLFTCLTGCEPEKVQVMNVSPDSQKFSTRDNFSAQFKFKDGSIANLIYTALGSKACPKEQMEIFVDGKVLQMSDYKEVSIFAKSKKSSKSSLVDKGHADELKAFAGAIKEGVWPISFEDQMQAHLMAFAVEAEL